MLTLGFISFLAPGLAVAGVLAVASPIIIHLLSRRHRKPVTWGAMRFLIAAYRQQRRRLQLEQLILLIARCLVLVLLGMALAGPILSGCAGRTASSVQQPGRMMWVVMDDSLSSQVQVGPNTTRFDEQKAKLVEMVNAMTPADKLAVWRLSDANDVVVAEPTNDRNTLLETIEKMRPRYIRPDWLGTFEQLSQTLDRQTDTQDVRQVIVLSGMADDEDLFGSQHQRLAEEINEQATLYIAPPAPGSVNIQIQSIIPVRRSVLLAQGGDASAPGGEDVTGNVAATVTLRRFAGLSASQSASLGLDLIDPNTKVIATQRREVTFAPGQATTTVNVDLPISVPAEELVASGPTVWSLRGKLLNIEGGDAIAADDVAWAAVELRQRLSVLVVDDPLPTKSQLTPGRWVELALSVGRSGDQSGLIVSAIRPQELGGSAKVETADALIVLRPDAVGAAAWQRLATRIDAGMVLIVTPPVEGVTTAWYGDMREQFDLTWRIQPEVMQLDPAGTLSTTGRSADALALLSGDLPQLVQSVQVERLLAIEASPESVWIGVTTADANGPWMLHQNVGRGSVVLIGSSFDQAWTNLQTKPMFVPLLHETLRSLCGGSGSALLVEAKASQQPALGEIWRTADRLVLQDEGANREAMSEQDSQVVSVGMRPTQAGAEPVDAVHEPGRYRATSVAGGLVVVNVDADAGNTQSSSTSGFERWSQASESVVWTADQQALPTVEVGRQGMSMLWPLLWAAMVLVLIETVLARIVSHATVAQRAGLMERSWTMLQRVGPWAARSGSNSGSAAGGGS